MLKQLFILFAAVILSTGCYHLGNPHGTRVSLKDITLSNHTQEPSLARMLNQELKEQISDTQGIRMGIADAATDKYSLVIDINTIYNKSIARSELRDKISRDKDEDAYQTVLNRVEIKVAVKAYSLDDPDTPVLAKDFMGHGDIPRMHDREVPLQAAYRQAMNDLAKQIVSYLTENKL